MEVGTQPEFIGGGPLNLFFFYTGGGTQPENPYTTGKTKANMEWARGPIYRGANPIVNGDFCGRFPIRSHK